MNGNSFDDYINSLVDLKSSRAKTDWNEAFDWYVWYLYQFIGKSSFCNGRICSLLTWFLMDERNSFTRSLTLTSWRRWSSFFKTKIIDLFKAICSKQTHRLHGEQKNCIVYTLHWPPLQSPLQMTHKKNDIFSKKYYWLFNATYLLTR